MMLTRAAYLDRLRRAFLLRVHPDRFRKQSQKVVQQQAQLVQALSNRLSEPDFQRWQNNLRGHQRYDYERPKLGQKEQMDYSLERRDGSTLRLQFRLSGSVDEIITTMTNALQKCGAGASIPPPEERPPAVTPDIQFSTTNGSQSPDSLETDFQRYSVVSNRGRDLLNFVKRGLDPKELLRRKMARTDAQASALAVRRLFKFQAVDATRLGWSSENVAILFKRLVELHVNYSSKFHVESFYPIRLVFAPFDVVEERRYGSSPQFAALDVYGGIIRLHPASTPIQWLVHLQQVRPETIDLVLQRRSETEQYKGLLRSRHNIQLLKGRSCSSQEFYRVLQRLCQLGNDIDSQPSSDSAVLAAPLVVKVEDKSVCDRRRPMVQADGSIRISEEMCSNEQLLAVISHLGVEARQKHAEYEREKMQCQEVAKEIQWQLGLARAVRRSGVLRQDHFLDSLRRMRRELNDAGNVDRASCMRMELAGTAIQITGAGHFCHLGDDGTITIPHDWT